MAVNQVSLSFYPPRWQQQLRTTITNAGQRLFFGDATPVPGVDAPPLPRAEVSGCLAEQGFAPVEWGRGTVFERGQTDSIFGPEKAIEVSVNERAGEVAELYCRFTLPRREPPPLSDWAAFVVALCERFHLRLEAEGVAPCGEAEFLDAVRSNHFYREFAAAFGWEVSPDDRVGKLGGPPGD